MNDVIQVSNRFFIAFFLTIFCQVAGWAQLSPGDLSNAHKDLEGISNCTKCHVLGDKVSNEKCLDCHKEIDVRIDARKGYHASKEVSGKECASCHSEHHGRKFNMIRFDEKAFDHTLTGYKLTGAHRTIDCRECHKPDLIDDRDLKKKTQTYLGLGTSCIDCHEDYHQQTLGNDCAKCHTTEKFVPAEKFDHDRTEFALLGQHKTVDCKSCHETETRNGKPFQKFSGIPFSNCNACHEDAHQQNLGSDCRQCHTEQSFNSHSGLRRFNHNRTNFKLKGKHQRIDCASCHALNASPVAIFQDKLGIPESNCVACHEDVHQGKFGVNCTDCHSEESFKASINEDRFDHNLTGFKLEGKHESVDCKKCHVSEHYLDPVPHNSCATCHQDYHQGEFASAASSPDCAECHTTEGFSPSQFSLEDHASSRFPLDGGHLATPCFACHLQEDRWHFRHIGERCVDCHQDVHENEIDTKYYPDNACEICHLTDSWTGINRFDHNQTPFELVGAHGEQKCTACHIRDAENEYGHFKGLSQQCVSCHENIHGTQFEKDGITDCARCHGFKQWAEMVFDHSLTLFPLEGKHAQISCDQCHKEQFIEGENVILYKIPRFECVDCHQ